MGTVRSIQFVDAPPNAGPDAQREYVIKEPVETMLSNRRSNGIE